MIKNFGQLTLDLTETHPLYNAIISKDNKWRKFKENIDFSFVNILLADKYSIDYGRPTNPEFYFKLLFIKIVDNLSDEELVKNVMVNMSYKYFLGINPEDPVCHSSALTKFRKMRLNDETILDELLSEVVAQADSKGLLKSNTLIVDATHTQSKHQAKSSIEILRELGKRIRRKLYFNFPEIKDLVPPKLHATASLEEEVEYTNKLIEFAENYNDEKGQIQKELEKANKILENETYQKISSLHDQEAKVGYKSEENSFNGYKSHIAITDERIIVGLEVTTGEASDGKQLKPLIKQANKRGIEVDEVLADGAYSGKDNLEYMQEQEISAVTPLNPSVMFGGKREVEGFEYNKDAGQMRCPAGHLSNRKARTGKKNQKRNQSTTYYFDIEKCKNCPLRDGCYKPGAKSKTYSITIKSEIHQSAMNFQQTETFKLRKKERYKIEAKNAELKQSHGFKECKFTGLFGMKIQSYMSAFAVNAKRILVLLDQKKEVNFREKLQYSIKMANNYHISEIKKKRAKSFSEFCSLFQWSLSSSSLFQIISQHFFHLKLY